MNSHNALGWMFRTSTYTSAPAARGTARSIARRSDELAAWSSKQPLVSLDELTPDAVHEVTGRLWQARITPDLADPRLTDLAVALVCHVIAQSPPATLERHQVRVRTLVRALDADQRAELYGYLGRPGSLRREFVDHLVRDQRPVARAYA